MPFLTEVVVDAVDPFSVPFTWSLNFLFIPISSDFSKSEEVKQS